MAKKICNKCKEPKDIEEDFHRQYDTPDGRARTCKTCIHEIHEIRKEQKKAEKELYHFF